VLIISLISTYIKLRTNRLIKDKKRLEAEVKARTAELEIKNRQLEETDRIKTHFFTDISHEIRTPLSLIMAPLETISKEETLNERTAGLLDIMKRNAQRLMQLVNQLLDISRLDADSMKISLVKDDIVKCLRILVYEFLSAAETKQIKYIAELPEKEFITWFDKDKIEKIISNLLSNALKFTPREETIQCTIKIEQDIKSVNQPVLNIKITDTGPGIENENLGKIFDRFFRVEGRIESDRQGTGIGLSVTKEFTSLMHGEIKVKSVPGKGSEFYVTLPLGKDHLSAGEYVIMKSESEVAVRKDIKIYDSVLAVDKKGKPSEETLKILIIEDNKDLRDFISENMATRYQVLTAENGRTGINMAFTMMPDLIVTDIMMPDIDGIQLCTRLKNDERTSHIPVILLTAKATADDKLQGLRTGADDYIVKPFLMEELSTRVENLLALREKLRLKYIKPAAPAAIVEKPESVNDRFMAKVIRIIGENVSNFDFDVEMLHERLGMSRMHLSRKIRILTGTSPHLFIRNLRLEKAGELLLKKSGNITEIAYSVGFSNASGFTKAFREYFGVSPKKYSRQ
jgi:signal transduction histidine kinase/AraC-like DNA-binding protein